MIARLRGTVLEISGTAVVVDVNGVGYEVLVPDSVALQLKENETVQLWTRQVFREDSQALYGFVDEHQRRVFDLLTEVKGCGPKIGLALLGQVGEDNVISAILDQDARALTRASGVGARLADRILLELKDKVQEEALRRKIERSSSTKATPVAETDELMEALLVLGYKRSEAESAASRVGEGELENRLREALKLLSR